MSTSNAGSSFLNTIPHSKGEKGLIPNLEGDNTNMGYLELEDKHSEINRGMSEDSGAHLRGLPVPLICGNLSIKRIIIVLNLKH